MCVCGRAILSMTNKIGFQIGGIISKMMMTVERNDFSPLLWVHEKSIQICVCVCEGGKMELFLICHRK